MDASQADAYLSRIGADHPAVTDAAALRGLQLSHLLTVPFENLSIHLGEDIVLTEEALLAKVVTARRGGFCYEVNGVFGALLTALGYPVSLHGARVFGADGILGPPFDHMALRVDAAGPWLVDAGFGKFSHHPIRLDSREDQHDPGGVFRVVDAPEGDLDILQDGEPQYRLEQRPRKLREFEPTCWWQRTSPASHFTQSLVCSMLTATGRITLSGRSLITTEGEERQEREVPQDGLLAAYREHFGIGLERLPVDPKSPDDNTGPGAEN
ncbi:arylamine N-acetyltransferase [Streptomyces sp. H10-C2]|uniref:arylamine N-acetyltransferase family protein n=1 Tax=unclassified Streptomyces TaxID=2593676 RepID=UPI0024B89206|nr:MULTISPECIES: arylamine N-acetyltransferase [unclassified Streptomyces]MDJ0340801.1 arylamine N-acetyltransferase [Streptomyces sp. PH10-H1]MDJ0371641.1 arylamine N-acetyltransferase [Streptomyces sp. H10-C2]